MGGDVAEARLARTVRVSVLVVNNAAKDMRRCVGVTSVRK